MSYSARDKKKEEAKLADELFIEFGKRLTTFYQLNHAVKNLLESSWRIHMTCYLNDNIECLENFDAMRLKHQDLLREQKTKEWHCAKPCGIYDENPIRKPKERYSYLNGVDRLQKEFQCLVDCINDSTFYSINQIEEIQKNISETQKFLL